MLEEYTGGASLGEVGGYVVGGLGMVVAMGQMAWSKFFSSEGKSNDALIQQLTDRIKAQEDGLQRLNKELDMERMLRRLEQNKVHSLVLYVMELKAELLKHGISVPSSSNMLHKDEDLAELLGLSAEDKDEEVDGSSLERTE